MPMRYFIYNKHGNTEQNFKVDSQKNIYIYCRIYIYSTKHTTVENYQITKEECVDSRTAKPEK